jgi:hypothetical protein
LHNEELLNLFSLPNIIRMIKLRRVRWTGHVARERRGMLERVAMRKSEGKRPVGRPGCRREDN